MTAVKPEILSSPPQVFAKPIIKSKVRILRADEYEALREGSDLDKNRIHLDTLLLTGMRYVEAQRLHDNPQWFDGEFIYLPAEAVKKHLSGLTSKPKEEKFVRITGPEGKFEYILAKAAPRKARTQVERWIRLSPKGKETVLKFFGTKQLPTTQTWWGNLKRWAVKGGLDPQGLSPKTTRKTWESWLTCTYPEHFNEIVLSQGHTSGTSLNHYLNMPFLPDDKARIRPWVEGFF